MGSALLIFLMSVEEGAHRHSGTSETGAFILYSLSFINFWLQRPEKLRLRRVKKF